MLRGMSSRVAVRALRPLAGQAAGLRRLSSDLYFQQPVTEVSTLSNGLRVASEHVPSANGVTLGVWIDAGSRYESAEENGVAHFLEHLLFKGTNSMSQRSLEEGVENIGAHLNAYTSREQTAYFARTLTKDAKHGLGLLADILRNSKLSPEAIDRERGVILREMEEVEKITEEVVMDYLHHAAYRGTALGRTILGPKENIQRFTTDDLQKYIKKHYTAGRMVVAAAGNIEHDHLVSWAEEFFGDVEKNPEVPVEKERAVFIGSDYRHRLDTVMPEAHVAYAFEVPGWKSPAHYPLMVLQSYLGDFDENSPYPHYGFNDLANKAYNQQFASKFFTFSTVYSDSGLFGLYFVAPPMKVQEAALASAKAITESCYDLDDVAFNVAKKRALTSLVTAVDDTTTIADDIGRQTLCYGRRIHPIEYRQRIDLVTKEDVIRVADKHFHDQDFALSAFGPVYELGDYNILRAQTYSKFR